MLVKGDLKSVINFNGGEIVSCMHHKKQYAVLEEVQSILVIANNFIWGALFVGNFKFLYQQKHLNTNTDINIPFSLPAQNKGICTCQCQRGNEIQYWSFTNGIAQATHSSAGGI